jgi:hypothetical protein
MPTVTDLKTQNYAIPLPVSTNRVVVDINRISNALLTIDTLLLSKQDIASNTTNVLNQSGTLKINVLPAYSGDVTSTAGTSTLTLSNSGVLPGVYNKVTVDAKGRVVAGNNEPVQLKTINGRSLFGSGNLIVAGGAAVPTELENNLDGGGPTTNYGGLDPIDGGRI